jgi:hypothetical protein
VFKEQSVFQYCKNALAYYNAGVVAVTSADVGSAPDLTGVPDDDAVRMTPKTTPRPRAPFTCRGSRLLKDAIVDKTTKRVKPNSGRSYLLANQDRKCSEKS